MRVDPLDQLAQGDPETVVDLPDGTALLGLHIRGLEGLHMLGIRADAQGRPLSFASADSVLHVDTLQSNPRRLTPDQAKRELDEDRL